uniref:Contactin 1b n=1 Tax=Electrophorus electricus TaxID=8005 RepID=A0A4W4HMQ1_ELEEL
MISNLTAMVYFCVSEEATGFGPIFEEEPLDTVYAEDSPEAKISMNCRVRANPPATIKWWHNNWEIKLMEQPDEHYSLVGGNLVITNPDKGKHAGKYVCVAKNIYGTVISKEAIVKFGFLDQFPTDEREAVYIKEGQGAVLLCTPPTRYPTDVMYRWIYNDFPNFIIPDQRRFVSQTTGNLYIAKVEVSDIGNYSCFVSSPSIGKSVFSTPIPLVPQIERAPEWAEHINDTEKDVGSELTLSCTAVGKPLPWIRWLKDGYSYGKGELKFSSLTFEDSGMYQCVAENNWGTIYANAELRVVSCAPTFIYNPVKRTLLGAKNGRVVIECKPRAAPKPRFIWKRGSQLLTNSSRMFIWDDGSLEILNVTKNDEGSYTCYAENDRGKDNSTGILSITEATEIIDGPSDVEVSVGGSAVLPCSASYDSSLDITFIWSVDSYVINFATDFKHYEKRMNQVNRGDLLIKDIQITHAGQYICTAQTIVDNATASLCLLVPGRPGPPGWVRVEEVRDTSVKLVWNLGSDHGSPLIQHVIQTRDFYALDPEDWKTAVTSPVFLDGKTETAEVTDLYPWMEYEFRAYAINELGAGESSLHSLKIKTWDAIPAMSPTDVHGYVGVNGELIVTWTPMKPQYFFGKKFGYVVMFKTYEEKEWHWSTVADPEARRFVYRDRLIPNTEIEVKVKGYNSKGEGPFSLTTVLFSSDSAVLPYHSPLASSSTSIRRPSPHLDLPPLLTQIRYWRKYDDNEASASRVLVSSSVNKTRLENMRPDSHYLIEVRAYNGAGLGPPSEHCEMFTRRAPPNRRLRVYKYVSYDRKWLYIYWDHIYNYWNESYVEGYKVGV